MKIKIARLGGGNEIKVRKKDIRHSILAFYSRTALCQKWKGPVSFLSENIIRVIRDKLC